MQVFVWVGPDKGEYRAGNIVEILEDGVHPGKLVVSGAWDSDCIMPHVVIVDVPGVTEAQATAAWGQLLSIPARLLGALRPSMVGRMATWSLPLNLRQRLATRKRATASLLQLRDLMQRRDGCSDAELLERFRAVLGDAEELPK